MSVPGDPGALGLTPDGSRLWFGLVSCPGRHHGRAATGNPADPQRARLLTQASRLPQPPVAGFPPSQPGPDGDCGP